jgi:acyl dehydratase
VKKDEVLEKLSVGRRGAIQVSTEAKIGSDEYRAAQSVTDAIDNLAELLTGDSRYFHIQPATAQSFKE